MKLTHRADSPAHSDYAHRPGGIHLTELQAGEEFAPDNFQLYIINATDDFTTPRHRHNFEQVRIMLRGDFEFGPNQVQREGTVGYFCEGTFYTQHGRSDSEMLLLQVAGASGQSYMSPRQLRQGIEDLKDRGDFRDGIFHWRDERGAERSRDSYEAIWEHMFERPLAYPRPRYGGPVIIDPQAFDYVPLVGSPGVGMKQLGSFNERGLSIAMVRLAAGASFTPETDQPRILYALSGSGQAGINDWAAGSSAFIARGERAQFTAEAEAEFYMFGLPRFEAA
jgi:hypothetical protein